MKTLIAYYSYTNNTKKVAESLAAKIGAELEEIKDAKSRGLGPLGFIRSGFEGVFKIKPKIEQTTKNPSEYDLVILACGTWASKMASPMRTYIHQNKGSLGKVAFLRTAGGSSEKPFAKDLKKVLPNLAVLFSIKDKDIKADSYQASLDEFASKIGQINE